MITTNRLRKGLLLALCFGSLQSVEVVAQSKWSDALVSFAARQTADREAKKGAQNKTGGKGDVTIQTMTAGRIVKFTNGSGAIEDSAIAESNGNIGIGITAPAAKLQIDTASGSGSWGNAIADGLIMRHTNTVNGLQIMHGGSTAFFAVNPDALGSGALGIGTRGALAFPIYFYTGAGILNGTASISGLRMTIDGSGNVGIGTTSPAAKLHVVGDISGTGTANLTLTGTGGNAANITVTGTGTSSGNITASGTISGGNVIAKYQDVAEWVPANRAMPAGTVVTLDPEHSNLVVASSHSYDTRVAGVVSEKPGVILGEGGEGKVMVATTGRVRVKVDATNGPIRVGDLLVTSDKEGIAMRSQPLDLGGTPIHRPGTLIGKALEPLEKGVGEILVLLSLQ